jgi:hypothetical protein
MGDIEFGNCSYKRNRENGASFAEFKISLIPCRKWGSVIDYSMNAH